MDFVPLFTTLTVLVSQAVAVPPVPFKRGNGGVHLRCQLDSPVSAVLTLETFAGDDRPRFGIYDSNGKFINDPDMIDWDLTRLAKNEVSYIAESFTLTIRYTDRTFKKLGSSILNSPARGTRPVKCERVGPIIMNP